LFYTNKTSDSIIFRDQLEALKNEYMMRFTLYHILTREVTGTELFSGRINAEKCAIFAKHFFKPEEINTCFICGPELHIQELSGALKEVGMREDQLKFELFGTTNSHVRPVEEEKVVLEGEDKMSRVTVRIDGHEADLQINYLGNNVLDTAINAGMDIPYSCKGGVCSTCKAQVVEGEVYMDVHYGLEPDEIDAGIVLTCQSHPRSERVILDYDIL
jgi:ring-1,2-phenylacetyl-CoA epoxidase subunit PaaE